MLLAENLYLLKEKNSPWPLANHPWSSHVKFAYIFEHVQKWHHSASSDWFCAFNITWGSVCLLKRFGYILSPFQGTRTWEIKQSSAKFIPEINPYICLDFGSLKKAVIKTFLFINFIFGFHSYEKLKTGFIILLLVNKLYFS